MYIRELCYFKPCNFCSGLPAIVITCPGRQRLFTPLPGSKFVQQWLVTGTLKAGSHITCRAHAVPLPCRAAKGLECVFPI